MLSTTSTRRGRYEVKDGDEIISSHNEPDKAQDSARETALLRNKTIQIQPPIYEIEPLEIFEGIPNSGLGASLAFSEYFTSDPGVTWRTNLSGACNNWPDCTFSGGRLVTPISYALLGPDGTGYIEYEIDAAATDGGNVNLNYGTSLHEVTTGYPLLEYWWRGLRYWDDISDSVHDLMGKFQYQRILSGAASPVSSFNFLTSNMSGHRTGTTTGAFSYNSSTGLWEGGKLGTGHGTITRGTAMIITDATLISNWGGKSVCAIYEYDSTTGNAKLYPNPNDGTIYNTYPVGGGVGYILMPNLGTNYTYTSSGNPDANGEMVNCNPSGNSGTGGYAGAWAMAAQNTTNTPVAATTGTMTFDDGVVITSAEVREAHPRIAADILSDPPNASGWLAPQDSEARNEDCFCWSTWTFGGGSFWEYIRLNGASPMNLAANSLNFLVKDHANENVEIKYYSKCNADIWVLKLYLTNEGAAAAGITDGNSGVVAGVAHFNNCLYLHFELPIPAQVPGWGIEWGAFLGNYNNENPGVKQRYGYTECSDATLYGDVDPFNAPFVKGLAT